MPDALCLLTYVGVDVVSDEHRVPVGVGEPVLDVLVHPRRRSGPAPPV
jgi:hypothetical protein